MNIWFLFQVAINIVLGLGLVVMWARFKRPPQDDPRLSRGLQLLQSKISVLEDLSDRTDKQVEQLTQLVEQKTRQLQTKIFDAEKQLQKVDHSMSRSLEVAEIFQDKIPHSEIIERQNTVKYVAAAQLAHKGHSIDEIAAKVDLPREQLEFIAKVNKDELMFDTEQLPAWAKPHVDKIASGELDEDDIEAIMTAETFAGLDDEDDQEVQDSAADDWGVANNFEVTQPELSNLKKLGEEFRQACVDFDEKQHQFEEDERRAQEAPVRIAQAAHKIADKIGGTVAQTTHRLSDRIAEKVQGTLADKMSRKIMDSSAEFLSEPMGPQPQAPRAAAPQVPAAPTGRSFLPIQPEVIADNRAAHPTQTPNPVRTTKVHSPSRFEDNAKMRVSNVPNSEIKKVLFPRIDLDDHLG